VHGLTPAEVEKRRALVRPNKLAEAKTEPGWHAFLRQYRDPMQRVLLGAAVVSIAALQEFSTGLVIIGLTGSTPSLARTRKARLPRASPLCRRCSSSGLTPGIRAAWRHGLPPP
jgi:hypothetical protein